MFDMNIREIDRIFLVKIVIFIYIRIIENYEIKWFYYEWIRWGFLGKKLVWIYYLSNEDRD